MIDRVLEPVGAISLTKGTTKTEVEKIPVQNHREGTLREEVGVKAPVSGTSNGRILGTSSDLGHSVDDLV